MKIYFKSKRFKNGILFKMTERKFLTVLYSWRSLNQHNPTWYVDDVNRDEYDNILIYSGGLNTHIDLRNSKNFHISLQRLIL